MSTTLTKTSQSLTSMSHVEMSAGVARMTLDLSDVEQADSALMAAIVLLARRCQKQGMRLYVRCSQSVRAWVELCRLDGMVDLAAPVAA